VKWWVGKKPADCISEETRLAAENAKGLAKDRKNSEKEAKMNAELENEMEAPKRSLEKMNGEARALESQIGKPRVLRQRRRLQPMADVEETEQGEDESPGSPLGQDDEESEDGHDHKDRIRYLNIQKQLIKIEIQKCYLKKCPNECGKGQVYDD
jgi:hypothetical protein